MPSKFDELDVQLRVEAQSMMLRLVLWRCVAKWGRGGGGTPRFWALTGAYLTIFMFSIPFQTYVRDMFCAHVQVMFCVI